MTSQLGTVNNIIQVKKTDFEVFDALMVDSQKCSDVSGAISVKFFFFTLLGPRQIVWFQNHLDSLTSSRLTAAIQFWGPHSPLSGHFPCPATPPGPRGPASGWEQLGWISCSQSLHGVREEPAQMPASSLPS